MDIDFTKLFITIVAAILMVDLFWTFFGGPDE